VTANKPVAGTNSIPPWLELLAIVFFVGIALSWQMMGAGWLRLLMALLLVFILPGYAISTALFPGGPNQERLGLSVRLLFMLMASISNAILGGLVLSQTTWGVQTTSWTIWLSTVTLISALITWLRRQRTPADPVGNWLVSLWQGLFTLGERLGLRWRDGLWLALALVGVIMVLRMAQLPAAPHGLRGYSMLWIAPGHKTGADAGGQLIQVGVRSQEFEPVAYKVQVTADGQLIQEWPAIQLDPNQQWMATLGLESTLPADVTVEASLYRLDQPNIRYRWVVLRPLVES